MGFFGCFLAKNLGTAGFFSGHGNDDIPLEVINSPS
jgi:hypothetical protein